MKKLSSLIIYLREVYQIWLREKPNQLAAALAYFGIFSFAAVLYFAYQFAGIFINEAAAAEQFYLRVESILGPEITSFIQDSVSALASARASGSFIVSFVSLLSLLWAATGLFLQLKYALNRIWGVPLIPVGKRFAFIWQQLFAFVMVISLGLLIIIATVINVFFAWFGSLVQDLIGGGRLLSILNGLALLGLIILSNAFINKVLPDVRLSWRDVWPGSVTASLLMVLGSIVIGLYFRFGGVQSAFEVAGAFAILMIAIYYIAQIFLFGAIMTRVYTRKFGSMRNEGLSSTTTSE